MFCDVDGTAYIIHFNSKWEDPTIILIQTKSEFSGTKIMDSLQSKQYEGEFFEWNCDYYSIVGNQSAFTLFFIQNLQSG